MGKEPSAILNLQEGLEVDFQEENISSLRHHLRTPVHQILGYTELILEDLSDRKETSYNLDLEKIHLAGRQLLTLIDESLDLMKIKLGKIDLEVVRYDLRSILDLIIGYNELLAEEALANEAVELQKDLQKIHTAATNLLGLFEHSDFIQKWELHFIHSQSSNNLFSLPTPDKETVLLNEEDRETLLGKKQRERLGGNILVVDDDPYNRDMLARKLQKQGHTIEIAENGKEALEIMAKSPFDLVLLDLMMPVMDGMQALEAIKSSPRHKSTPVIMLSAMNESEKVIQCVENGAEDYLPKPCNPALLDARIYASLEKKKLRDKEQNYIRELYVEKEKSNRLLLNILPKSIAERQQKGETNIVDSFSEATVLFANVNGLAGLSIRLTPAKVIQALNDIYSGFDWLAEWLGFEKVNAIGDSYMVAGGVPTPCDDHAEKVAEMALEMEKVTKRFNTRNQFNLNFRMGISSGPIWAGIVGRKNMNYYLWGDTVNIASSLELECEPGSIQVSAVTYNLLKSRYTFQERGLIKRKMSEPVMTYFLTGRADGVQPRIAPAVSSA